MGHQTRAEWLAERRKGVGGSDVAAILGMDPYRTALDVYLDKIGQHPTPLDDNDLPEPVLWGNLLEPVIADEVERRTGLKVFEVDAQVHPDHEWMRVNIDRGLNPVRGMSTPNTFGVLECKTTSTWRAADWVDDQAPRAAVTQVCWAFAVTGWEWGKVAGLIGGQRLRIVDVEYDPELVALIVERVGSFWHDHVVTRRPPPVVAADVKLLSAFYRGGCGVMTADEDAIEAAKLYDRYRHREGYYRQQKQAAAAQLRQALGDYDEAVSPSGDRVAWFTDIPEVKVAAHTKAASRRLYVRKGIQ